MSDAGASPGERLDITADVVTQALVQEYFRLRSEARRHLVRADRLVMELLGRGLRPGERVVLESGEVCEMVDHFADGTNLAWKSTPMRRYEMVLRKNR